MDAPTNEEGGPSLVDEGVAMDTHDDYCVQIDEIDTEERNILSQTGQALRNFAPYFTRQIQSTMEETVNNEIARRIREEVTTVVRDVEDLWRMHQIAKGLEFEKEAEKKLSGWNIFGFNSFKHRDAGNLYEKAATFYKLAKSWDQAGAAYVKSAQCHLKEGDSKYPLLITFGCEAAIAYGEAAHAYKKTNTNTKECISCLEQAVNLFIQIGDLSISAKYCEEIAELYEEEQNLQQTISYYDKAAEIFQCEELKDSVNQCKQKIVQFSAQLEQYQKAVDIYEEIARQSLNDKFLKYFVSEHLFNAGICQLCKGDFIAITNALERYQELDPKFSETCEYRLLADLAAALDEVDVVKFTDAVKEFNCMIKLDKWNTALLLRVELLLKAKE